MESVNTHDCYMEAQRLLKHTLWKVANAIVQGLTKQLKTRQQFDDLMKYVIEVRKR